MKYRYKFWIKTLIFMGWMSFVLWHFFQHFPFINLLEIVLNGSMLLILLLFFTALGKCAFRYTNISFTSYAEECCFSYGLGTSITIFLVIVLAALGVLYEALIVFLVLALYVLVYKDARYLCIKGSQVFSTLSFRRRSGLDIVFMLLMGCAGVVTFLAAATPPFFYDALVYHLAVPHQYLLHHGFQYLPQQHFSNFPANLGMLFIIAMSFSGGMLAQLLSWSFAPLTALVVYAFVKTQWGCHVAITSATIMFLVPGLLIVSTLTGVDSGVMFYSFLCFSALLSWFKFRLKYWFVLAGIFCSLAVGTKYTAIVTTFFPVAILLFIHEYFGKKCSLLVGLRKMILLGLIVFCGASPWFIKNSFYTRNPIYPFFNSVFGSQVSQLIEYDQYISRDHSLFTKGQHRLDVIWIALKAPWTVTMTTNGAAGKTGVLFLLCLPCVVFLKNIDGTMKYLLAIAGCSFGFWVFLLPRTLRYVFPIFPPLSIVIAYILWHIPVSHRGRKLILAGMSLLLFYHIGMFLSEEIHILRPFAYLLGNQSKEDFLLDHGVEYYPVIQYVNRETPENSKILFVGESRGYYCERDYLVYTVITGIDDNELILRKLIVESQNVEEVVQKLRQMKITHILFNTSEMKRFTKQYLARDSYFGFQTEKEREIYRNLFAPQYLRPLISQDQVYLYEIMPPEGKT